MNPMPAIRAFFAIDLPESVQAALHHVQQSLQKHDVSHRLHWTQPVNLHVTLQFLKEVKSTDIDALIKNVSIELAKAATFELTLGQLELFPSSSRPRLISMQTGPHDDLSALSHLIGQGILNTHYPIETRPFRGHLTLGRFNDYHNKDFSFENIALPVIEKILVTEILFFQSSPSNEGSHYAPLARLKLPTRRS
jgi:2'-5' RNA ligase